jgi:NADPH:quinone reductase
MAELPTRMTAIGIKAPGGPEMLVPEQRTVPTPGDGEILVMVAAARRQPA